MEPTFFVRDVPIYGDVILAPMARFSDVPYRALCRAYGSAMNYTEFVPAEALLGDPNPMWRRLDKKPGEKPLVFQIFGNNARTLLAAAQRIEAWEPDIIDINMGCSVPKVSERGAGVGMMPRPELVRETFALLSKHLRVPVTGKIRLGWDDSQRNFLHIARILEDNGASLIALHGRTREQKYDFAADWDAIATLKQTVRVPVIGNGDIRTPADIAAMKTHTGCEAVMVGRAAVGNPWIFARRGRETLTMGEIVTAVKHHLHEMLAYYGDPDGIGLFGRHLRRYFLGLPVKPWLQAMLDAPDAATLEQLLDMVAAELSTSALLYESL